MCSFVVFACVSTSIALASEAPAHPVTSSYVGVTIPEIMEHRVDGRIVATSAGDIACFQESEYVVAASWHGMLQQGSKSMQVSWIGWNNISANKVDRYLIIKELDTFGNIIGEECTTYPDVNPEGFYDPLPLMASRYNLTESEGNTNEYVYEWNLQNGAVMTSTMITDAPGFPPQLVSTNSELKSGHQSSYNFVYGSPQEGVDTSVFYEHEKYKCETVSNFTSTDVCISTWLVLQYECAHTTLEDSRGHNLAI